VVKVGSFPTYRMGLGTRLVVTALPVYRAAGRATDGYLPLSVYVRVVSTANNGWSKQWWPPGRQKCCQLHHQVSAPL